MSLVAYDSSDDEKDEEIVTPQPSQLIKSKSETALSTNKQRECVKITIPSLKEFEEEENPVPVKRQKFQPGSGLFSLLPPPKNSPIFKKTDFVPYVLSSKKSNKEAVHAAPSKTISKPPENESVNSGVLDEPNYDETSYDEESSKQNTDLGASEDFFSLKTLSSDKNLDVKSSIISDHSLNDPSAVPETSNIIHDKSYSVVSSKHDLKMNESVENLYMQHSQEKLPHSEQVASGQDEQLDSPVIPYADHPTDNNYSESLLSDKEFLKLKGRRREFEAVDIIDVNADDQLTDRNEWLMKSLTEESTHRPSRKKHNMPTQQQKRKHQITYLAFQAKEREMDLKNQWALNSRTRRETQAKYGF